MWPYVEDWGPQGLQGLSLSCLTLLPFSLAGRPPGGAPPSDVECANGAKTLQRLFQFPTWEGQLIHCQCVPGEWQVTRGGPLATQRASLTTGRGKPLGGQRMMRDRLLCSLLERHRHTHKTPWHAGSRAVKTATLPSTLWIGQPRSPPPRKSLLHTSRCHRSLGSEGEETGPPLEGLSFCSKTGRGDDVQQGQRKQEWGSGVSPKANVCHQYPRKVEETRAEKWGGPLGHQRTDSRCAGVDPHPPKICTIITPGFHWLEREDAEPVWGGDSQFLKMEKCAWRKYPVCKRGC